MAISHVFILSLLAFSCAVAYAFEPSPLQARISALQTLPTQVVAQFSIIDLLIFKFALARVNGHACLDSKLAQADHFFLSGLHITGNTSNPLDSRVTPVTVDQIFGLNTLGLSLARLNYAPWGLIPPHTHPRATEILTVVKGSLYAGFVTSNPENRLISKVLKKGDVFIFPVGLVHFQQNVGCGNAILIAALSSQNPGVITVASAVFGSKPPIEGDVLAKAFQVDKSLIDHL